MGLEGYPSDMHQDVHARKLFLLGPCLVVDESVTGLAIPDEDASGMHGLMSALCAWFQRLDRWRQPPKRDVFGIHVLMRCMF